MKTLKFLLQKEFRQILRNKSLLFVLFAVPIIYLLILPLAADYEIKNINISIVDQDRSAYSRNLISKITASGYFKLADYGSSFDKAYQQIEKGKSDLILEIPQGFEKNIVRENTQKLFIAVNAINGIKANIGAAYLDNIILNYNADLRLKWIQTERFNQVPTIQFASSNWFNVYLNYTYLMVPGILAILVTMIGVYLCSMNIVVEKEVGTIEQINVTPIKKVHFILGKLIPFWIIGVFIFSIGLFLVARLVYGIVPLGSIWLMYSFLAVYLAAVLGIGLLISTYAETLQQTMSIGFFYIMIILLMSGLFTPVDSMPEWAQWISKLSPVTYFIDVMRMVVLKGSSFNDIKYQFLIITSFAVLFNGWAILNYKKTN